MSFFSELKRRKVFRVGVTYIIAGWIIIQVADTLLPTYGAPAWVMPVFTTMILLGFPLSLVLAWALEVSPSGVHVTHDGDTNKGSPSGLILNFVIMGVMAAVILWLVIDQSRVTDAPSVTTVSESESQPLLVGQSNRLPNSIAVLPFENLSPDPDNAYFAAGIHDTVLHELAKISDMNVIARTSVLPYAGTALPIAEIAETLNVENIMEGTVQYAEGHVRITAQLINPETGAHIWSGNFDRPFSDVFTIQSEIAQSIANAIGSELLPQELQLISQQYTSSEEAYSLFLLARALVPNIAPSMPQQAKDSLERAIELDPEFIQAHAMLAFHYALSLGNPDPDLDDTEKERRARQYTQNTLDLDPNNGQAAGAQALLAMAYLNDQEAELFWNKAVELSPNDSDVLDDAIRFFATSGNLARANLLAARIENINPNALGTVQMWLAMGSSDFIILTDFMNNEIKPGDLAADILPFFIMMQGTFEAILGNNQEANRLLDQTRVMSSGPQMVMFEHQIYGYGLVGRLALTRQLQQEYFDFFDGKYTNTAQSVIMYLATSDEQTALEILKLVAENPSPQTGGHLHFSILARNLYKNPILEKPEFVEARRLFGIPIE